MADRIAFFGTITHIGYGEHGIVTITLDHGVRLRAPAIFMQLLQELLERQWPVHFEAGELLDVMRVRLPRILQVDRIEGTFVTFEDSDVLAHTSDEGILHVLHEALRTRSSVAVTIADNFEVIDARPFPGPPPDIGIPVSAPSPEPELRQSDCVPPGRAQELFDLCARRSCDPLTVPKPCITFLYPDDGCWARAHEMARLILHAGARPRKIWIYGGLKTPTRNNPCCFVPWRFHVAPTICVCVHPSLPVEEQVIDPALFTTPVPIATWAGVQEDPSATFVSTSPDIFSRFYGGEQIDPTYTKTEGVLAFFRASLKARSLSIGPPPYVCPPPRPCV